MSALFTHKLSNERRRNPEILEDDATTNIQMKSAALLT